jgi:hypothetical protein
MLVDLPRCSADIYCKRNQHRMSYFLVSFLAIWSLQKLNYSLYLVRLESLQMISEMEHGHICIQISSHVLCFNKKNFRILARGKNIVF